MEERVKTSFIPKASLAVEQKQVHTGGQVALANLIAGIILVLAILGAGGLFLFQQYTIQNIASQQASLNRSRAAFEPATIKELSRLNGRIESAKTLLTGHVELSKLFDELEKLTLASVRFDDFTYTNTQGDAILTANGEAQSYNAVAVQSGDFSKSAVITDPIFSDVNIGKGGTIHFVFNAVIDTDQLHYSPGAASSQSTNQTQTPPAQSGTNSTSTAQ